MLTTMNWSELVKPVIESVLRERINHELEPEGSDLVESYKSLVNYVLYLRHEFRQYYTRTEAVRTLIWDQLRDDEEEGVLDLLMSMTQLFHLRFPGYQEMLPHETYQRYVKALAASRMPVAPESYNRSGGGHLVDGEFIKKVPSLEDVTDLMFSAPWLVFLLTLEDHLSLVFEYPISSNAPE